MMELLENARAAESPTTCKHGWLMNGGEHVENAHLAADGVTIPGNFSEGSRHNGLRGGGTSWLMLPLKQLGRG
jgi:hypothetical protein